jgi:hypothetical protein
VTERYGATVDAVLGELRSLALDPAEVGGDVERRLDDVGGRVAARVGSLSSWAALDPDATLLSLARASVTYGAASLTFDAEYPERAATTERDTAYGAVLWNRHEILLAELEAAIAREREDPLTGLPGMDGSSAVTSGSLRILDPEPRRPAVAGWWW